MILPMVVLRRLDCLLEPTKEKVLGKSLARNQESEPLFTLRWSVV
jgi:type I restriction-modification system DNA methylase subunit